MPKKYFRSSFTDIFNTSDIMQPNSNIIYSRNLRESSSTMKNEYNNNNRILGVKQIKSAQYYNSINYKSWKNLKKANTTQTNKDNIKSKINNKEKQQNNSIENSLLKQQTLLGRQNKATMNQSNIFNLKEKDEENEFRYHKLYQHNNYPSHEQKLIIPTNNKIRYRNKGKTNENKATQIDNENSSNNNSVHIFEINQSNNRNTIDVKDIQRYFRNNGLNIYEINYHDSFTFGNQKCLLKIRANNEKISKMNKIILNIEKESNVNFSKITVKRRKNV